MRKEEYMAILRERKKKIILAATAGFLVGALPLGIFGAYMTSGYLSVKSELKKAEETYLPYECYVLNKDIEKGEKIKEGDIERVVLYSDKIIENTSENDIVGKAVRHNNDKGIIVTSSMVYDDLGISNDLRMCFFDCISVPMEVDENDIFDIRVSFPNGEDYIVATEKKLEGRNEAGIFINATEEELLKISSAKVDTKIYEGAKIYASVYISDYQESPMVNYPVNMYVTKLGDWNPNLIEKISKEADREKRNTLENNLFEFMGVTMNDTYVSNN